MIGKTLLVGASSTAMVSCLLAGAVQAKAATAGPVAGAVTIAAAGQAQDPKGNPSNGSGKKRKRGKAAEMPAVAKPAQPATVVKTAGSEDAPSDEDIIVRGVRSSLAEARAEKRESDAIVDVVKAEDIGKLPNNTVGDVIASIPGISVYRSEGEVNTIQLRGLDGVQTTLGGTPIESGADRVASIADLPADLVKSVEVYKTRTPDQVEGSGAGSINIEFRTPADFKRGLTVSGNVTGRYNNQSGKMNQVYTAIANYGRDTGIGTVGAQFGVTVNYNPFLESQAHNDPLTAVQTRQVVGPQLLPQPTYAPSQVFFGYTTGSRTTPTYNGALEWSQGGSDVVLDGTYAAPKFDRYTNTLYMPVLLQAGSTNNLPALSNITLVPGTNRIASVTVSPVTQVGPISYNSTSDDSNFLVRLRAKHHEEQFDASAEIAYTGANRDYQQVQFRNRFINRPTFDVEFASTKFRYPMMNLEFRDLDLMDPAQYRFAGAAEDKNTYSNRTLATRADLTLRTFGGPVDWFKFGMRFTTRSAFRNLSTRSVSNLQIDPALLPSAFQNLVPIAQGFEGTGVQNNARWLSYDRFAAREGYPALRQYLTQFAPIFATDDPPQTQASYFKSTERTVAAYGMTHYRVKLLLPIDGIFGVRATNTIVGNRSFASETANVVQIAPNGSQSTVAVTTVTPKFGKGNYITLEPTATAIVHFTPRLQARLSYNIGIRRPNVDQITPYISFSDTNFTGTGGNPDLKPEKTTRYDAIIEYYFNRQGLISINPFYWKLKGAYTNAVTAEALGSDPTVLYQITRPYNAGDGYRKGVELQAQTFFTFLPGFLKNFGVVGNYTYVDSKLSYNPIPGSSTIPPGSRPLTYVAKHVWNAQALFERKTLNARVSYNFNGAVLDSVASVLVNSQYVIPRDWMDAAINYTIPGGPLKNLGFSLQVQNVLASARRSFYGYPDQPRDVIYMARTYGGTLRYRF